MTGFSSAKKRLICLGAFAAVLGIEVLIALFVRDAFVRPYLGDVLAVVCVYLLARTIFIERPRYMSVLMTAFAFAVELVQLTPLSEILPSPLSVIVGGTFDFKDLLCYLVGGALCFLADKKSFPKSG